VGERDAGLLMLHAQWKRARRRTVGADEAYDVQEFIDVTRELGCTPHSRRISTGQVEAQSTAGRHGTRTTR
jgi:hypothetical protein